MYTLKKEEKMKEELRKLFEADNFEFSNIVIENLSMGYEPILPEFETAEEYFQYYEKCIRENKEETAKKSLKKVVHMDENNERYLKEYAMYNYFYNAQFCYVSISDYWLMDSVFWALNKLIEINPNNVEYHLFKAKAFNKIGKNEEAINIMLNVIKLEPDNYQHYEILGDYYFSNKQSDKAIEYYSEAIKYNKYDSNLYFKRGNVYSVLENDVAALKDANVSLAYKPKNKDALHLKYEIYLKYIDEKNYDYSLEAISYINRVINETMRDKYYLTKYLYESVELYYKIDDYERALENIDRLIQEEYILVFCINHIKKKIKILLKLHRYLQIIPTFILLLKKLKEERSDAFTPIE